MIVPAVMKLVFSLYSCLYTFIQVFKYKVIIMAKITILDKGVIMIAQKQIKYSMQATQKMSTHLPSEKEYNFRVKVNYNNGAITVHGPNTHSAMPFPAFRHPQTPMTYGPQPIVYPLPVPIAEHPLQVKQPFLPCSPSSFSISTSPSIFPENIKTNQVINNPNMCASGVGSTNSAPTEFHRESQSLKSNEKQQQIDCVICEKKFKETEFAYHLELHRNPRRKTEQVHTNSQNHHENSLQEVKPQFLYSFHRQSSVNNSIREQNSVRESHKKKQETERDRQQSSRIQSLNSSIHSGQPQIVLEDSATMGPQSGIRYLSSVPAPVIPQVQVLNNSVLSRNSRDTTPVNQQPGTPIFVNRSIQYSHGSNSVRSSQMLGHKMEAKQQQHPSMQVASQPEKSRQSINPFELMEQEESKIYQYFPESGHYSLSQHRAGGQQAKNTKNASYQVQPNEAQAPHNRLNFIRHARNNNKQEMMGSRVSASSISSIRSLTQPLEDMSRCKILRTYHNNRNRIDLSNIIGMSQVLAREGVPSATNQTRSIQIQQQQSRLEPQNKTNRSSNNFKVITANSMILQGEDKMKFQQPDTKIQNRHDLQMLTVQNRQIYRATQVEEDDFRGFQSVMNVTRSSKSSAKTKIPKNFLAVNDFISGGGSQHKL